MNEYRVVKDFELERNADGWTAVKYVGFDVEYMEIPSTIDGKKITEIGKKIFQYNEVLKAVKLQNGIKRIGESAFSGSSNIEHIDLPDSLTEIGIKAFKHMEISTIVIPDSVTYVGEEAFGWCSQLVHVHLSNNMESISDSLFDGCLRLQELYLPQKIQTIGKSAFHNTKIKEINLPDSLKTIGKRAFASAKINGLVFPDSLEIIDDEAFSFSNITGIIIPPSVKTIGEEAFSNSKLVSVVILPGSKAHIGEGAFLQNEHLKHLFIPESVTELDKMFYGVSEHGYYQTEYAKDESGNTVRDIWGNKVKESVYHDNATLGNRVSKELTAYCSANSAFMELAKKLHIKCDDYNANVQEITDDIRERPYTISSSAISNSDAYLHTLYELDLPAASKARVAVISNKAKVIKGDVYSAMNNIDIVEFEEGSQLERIGKKAFAGCFRFSERAKIMTIPASVKVIEKGAFVNCKKKIKILIPSTCRVEDGAVTWTSDEYKGARPKFVRYNPKRGTPRKGGIKARDRKYLEKV